MDRSAIFAAAGRERRGVADLLESLDERQLATPSLCAGWDVHTVAAHLAAGVALSWAPWLAALVRQAGHLHRANDAVARQMARRGVAELVALLRRHADRPLAPPLVGPRGPLTDLLVHTGDMRLPLGLPHDPPGAAVRVALAFVTTGHPVGFTPRGRLAGLRLVADDLGWAWGAGPPVRGRGIDVLMAACGRAAVLAHLTGPGVATLSRQLPASAG